MGGILLLLLMMKIMLSTWGYSIVVVVNDDNHAIHMGVFYSIDRYEDWHPMSSHAQAGPCSRRLVNVKPFDLSPTASSMMMMS